MTSLFTLEKEADAERLTTLLADSNTDTVRQRSAEILGDLDVPDDEVVESLTAAAQDDPDAGVRAAAIDALDQREAVEQLISAIVGEEISGSQAEWARAEALTDALSSDQPELRMAAANVLGRIGSRSSAQDLIQQLPDPDPRVRSRVARALGRLEDRRAVSALAKRRTDEVVEVRRETAEALGRMQGDEALSILLGMLNDPAETVRRIAAGSLGNFGSVKPLDALIGLLSDKSEAVRKAAVFSLIELLSNAPPEQSHELRETMVEKLSASDHRVVVSSLIDIIEQGSQAHQRRNATWLLGRVTGEHNRWAAIEALVSVLDDEDGMTSQFAVTSLATIGGESVETALLELLSDPEATTDAQAMAAFGLGKVGGERSRERLDSLVDTTDDEEVRKRAFSALSKLGGRA
ncbi:HEAT repeat domain-containing protein [Haladaptatus cibarius]|uniref:HEAT repeat domain-containing protein n=1 Tax=Haladaptatus cibarius TaxID=453847 RepID=UPI00067939F4|nr:HEAT repeat domain-containing protein [Haladaptatus cibarius]